MPCLVALIGFFFPRLAIVLLVIFSNYLGAAYQTILWPVLGFIFAPFTTLAYAFAINHNGGVSGLYLALVVFAALMDLGVVGGGASSRRSKVEVRRVR